MKIKKEKRLFARKVQCKRSSKYSNLAIKGGRKKSSRIITNKMKR